MNRGTQNICDGFSPCEAGQNYCHRGEWARFLPAAAANKEHAPQEIGSPDPASSTRDPYRRE